MFYEVENEGDLIAGVIGYDSIRKHLAECVMNTGTYKKEIQSFGMCT